MGSVATSKQVSPINYSNEELLQLEKNKHKIAKFEEKRSQMEREIQKCQIQEEILMNKMKFSGSNASKMKVSHSKLDVGLSKCFLNKQLI